MVIRKASPTTDQYARSLLQKAVRRANAEIAHAAFRYLEYEKNDSTWLRSRLAVMVFEESWPYGVIVNFGRDSSSLLRHYVALCCSSKNKDAAGLGALAYAYSRGDQGVLEGNDDDWYVRVISKAITATEQFWNWIGSQAVQADPHVRSLVQQARDGSKKAGWPWDKAFAYAAALLAIKKPMAPLESILPQRAPDFPYWVAVDKHTPKGKEVLRGIARDRKLKPNVVLWLSFYLESGYSVERMEGVWWEREKAWRFRKLGLTALEAANMWGSIRSEAAKRLENDAEMLARRVTPYLDGSVNEKTMEPKASKRQSLLFR